MVAAIQNLFQIDRQKLMGVSLLSNSISAPNRGQRSNNGQRICSLSLIQHTNELVLFTLEAKLVSLANFAQFGVFAEKTELKEGNGVGQTLHHRVEEARVSVVVHSVSHAIHLSVLVSASALPKHQIHGLVVELFIVARFTALRNWL